ncbi:MAG: hypothetical protein J2P37_13790, partial [Ktedonobacteraceae bacterium]|nr:hypothetical protein [Ktedonobacteraceae bacterium]
KLDIMHYPGFISIVSGIQWTFLVSCGQPFVALNAMSTRINVERQKYTMVSPVWQSIVDPDMIGYETACRAERDYVEFNITASSLQKLARNWHNSSIA